MAEVHRLTGGGVDCSFEAIGLKQTIRQAVLMTRKGGAVYLIGVNDPTDKLELTVVPELISAQRTITSGRSDAGITSGLLRSCSTFSGNACQGLASGSGGGAA